MIWLKLNSNYLKKIYGGISAWAILGMIAGIIFSVGGVDGYVRPVGCRK